MKWLSEQYVRDEAKKGRKEALLCSRKHWEQLCTATQNEMVTAPGFITTTLYCGMCKRYHYGWRRSRCLSGCVLKCSAKKRWGLADHALVKWQESKTFIDFLVWRKQARIMLLRINQVIERLYGKGV